MYAGIFMLGILGYTVNLIFLATERRILRWHRGWRASELGAQGGG
jgi:ABC-type nitrate/sulfonate/bicarbonate transport system permease component